MPLGTLRQVHSPAFSWAMPQRITPPTRVPLLDNKHFRCTITISIEEVPDARKA